MNLSNKNKLVLNTMFSAISRGSEVIFLLLLIMAARYLGVDEFGKFSFALALTSMFIFTTDLGLKTLLIREIARDKNNTSTIVGNALILKAILSVLTATTILFLAKTMSISQEVRIVIYLLTFSMIFKSFKLLLKSVIIANERFKLETLTVVIERCLLIVFGSLTLVLGYGLIQFAIVFSTISMVNFFVTLYLVRKKICHIMFLGNISIMTKLLRASLPFCLASGVFHLYFRIDSVMLSLMRDNAEVGWYNAAYRINEGLLVFPMILYYVLFPRLSILHQVSKTSVERLVQKGCKYLIALSMPIAFLGIVTAKPFILLIYGDEYSHSVIAWQILLIGISFMFLWNIFIVLLNSTNHPKIPFIGGMIGALVNVILNYFLIPAYGYLGASVSTVISELVLFSFLFIILSKYGYKFDLIKSSLRPILATVLSIPIIFLVRDINILAIVLIGSIIYILILYLSRFFDAEEIKLLRELKSSLMKLRVFNH